MSTSFYITKDDFSGFGDDSRGKVEHAIATSVFIIERKASSAAPFKTGFLKNSIGSQAEGLRGEVYADAWYALYQEGRPYNRHFLEDSLHSTVAQLPAILAAS